MGWILIIGGLLAFGFIVDWFYKSKGIDHLDPSENEKHVSESERVYIGSHLHNIRNDHTNGPL
ncbi:hypothetical protein [Neobacillus terrae]|uniref:hypothetical protein n=1 Tax=Neobacillus terrae TaxID=3034837 RepID=UPI00140C2FB8|nr:hypothetical protein [Neobacillus terrae]NHM32685.1 hypothetical protein [Neobacillus terrae]